MTDYSEIWIDGVVSESMLAVCLEFEAGMQWIPKSVLSEDSIDAINKAIDTDNTTIPMSVKVAEWYALEQGIE